MDKRINVTKVFLPPLETYTEHVKRAFDNEWLTNRGPLVLELEEKLKGHLGVPRILIMNNGTIPLQIAMHLLGDGGEIITTPFSYVATSAAIVWEGCTPVFVDIERDTLTIDPTLIEAAITPYTKGILATHVFGNPCDIEAIEAIAKKHDLFVMYDAAHCFGVEYKGQSIFNYGDLSSCSFHATKLFHTGEGGAVFTNSEELMHKIFYSHNFGHDGPLSFHGIGINGKISELQAAMGLSVLPFMPEILANRKAITDYYGSELADAHVEFMQLRAETKWNYSYFPIIFESESVLEGCLTELNANHIFARRYFYPSLNTIPYTKGNACTISEDIAARILCLPLFADLTLQEAGRIVSIIKKAVK